MKAWHFVSKGNRLNYGDNRLVRVGITHTVDCKPILCQQGLHGSKRIIDALSYADYHVLYRVDIKGDIDEGDDKLCGQSRTYLQRFDMDDILFEFSRWAAKQNITKIKPYTNKEDYALIIKWLDTGDQKIKSAARSAAAAAAELAAWAADSATSEAAWEARAAAARAARSAARAATATATATATARSAARSAAESAAWAAAEPAAAWEAAQEKKLCQMIKAKYGEIK